MKQGGKALVLAITAIFVTGVGVAHAENGITAEEYPTTLHGQSELNILGESSGSCTESTTTGEITEETTEMSLLAPIVHEETAPRIIRGAVSSA